jgi:hypothetical protein
MFAVRFTSDQGEQLTVISGVDSWQRDSAFAAPGAATNLPISLVVAVKDGRVQHVTVRPVYAEFDDGSRFGPTAEELHRCLASERRSVLAASKRLLAAYAEGGHRALMSALQAMPELEWLFFVQRERGAEALLSELKKTRRLPL